MNKNAIAVMATLTGLLLSGCMAEIGAFEAFPGSLDDSDGSDSTDSPGDPGRPVPQPVTIPGQIEPWPGQLRAWPAESRQQATSLFTAGPNSVLDEDNWSGAHWNPQTQTLWLCRNRHGIRSYVYNGTGFVLDALYSIDADLEGITQADYARPEVYTVAEKEQQIRQYDVSGATPVLLQSWDISSLVADGQGMEGIVFIPDSFLATQGFRDAQGALYPRSVYGTGGVFLVSHQSGGDIFALDLEGNGNYSTIGRYRVPLASTRGLEFDREGGVLYMVDGTHTARSLVAVTGSGAGSPQGFGILDLYGGPGPDGAEGIAVAPAQDGIDWAVITDDDNTAGNTALLWYRNFTP
ncbi:MAG: hypothetical protein MJE77_22730 [Proteobacteria bacterium]|nr:hypothetical protein [Pseudomonadota bacterium]